MSRITITELDHIVLNVSDVEKSLSFYLDELGLEPHRVDDWRNNAAPFPSVRINGDTIIDLVESTPTGENLNHFCFVIDKVDFESLIKDGNLPIETGPASRSGARGIGISVYLRDPDHNLVELRYYD